MHGAVYQKDREIVDVGKYDIIKTHYHTDEEIGSEWHVVMPGFVNAHLASKVNRERVSGFISPETVAVFSPEKPSLPP